MAIIASREYWVNLSGDEDLLFADGFDDAIIGVSSDYVVCYDVDAVIRELEKTMTPSEAIEFLDFNILGAHVGERTPIFIKLGG